MRSKNHPRRSFLYLGKKESRFAKPIGGFNKTAFKQFTLD